MQINPDDTAHRFNQALNAHGIYNIIAQLVKVHNVQPEM
jgi:hypothetical protein